MEDDFSQLKLENQICFPLYAASRLVIQQYKPLLDQLGITYPQYLVLLVLWETDGVSIKEISKKLLLETNTLTPLLKRMESNGIIERKRQKEDERIVLVSLTEKGHELKIPASEIPHKLANQMGCLDVEKDSISTLKKILDEMVGAFQRK